MIVMMMYSFSLLKSFFFKSMLELNQFLKISVFSPSFLSTTFLIIRVYFPKRKIRASELNPTFKALAIVMDKEIEILEARDCLISLSPTLTLLIPCLSVITSLEPGSDCPELCTFFSSHTSTPIAIRQLGSCSFCGELLVPACHLRGFFLLLYLMPVHK